MLRELKEGAIFITDAHYPRQKKELLALFDTLLSSPPPQLFLLGDMFEFLCPSLPYTLEYNKEAIEKIDALSRKTELFYLEGNHDYLLNKLFLNASVYTLREQPLLLLFKNQKIALFHGDKYGSKAYLFYSALIRNPFVIKILRVLTLDINGRFIKTIYPKLLAKKICNNMNNFAERKRESMIAYPTADIDAIIEGHNHIRASLEMAGIKYEALGAFACNKSFFKVESKNSNISFVEMSLGVSEDEQT